ncbi:MAG: DMT family transporter [Acetobacteraceae bacterium]|nr:DMT family transporter [Acetobacteraceae bacterium]
MTAARHLPFLLLTGGIWGLTPSLAKLAIGGGVQPLAVAFQVALGSSLFLFAICALRRVRVPWDAAHLRHYTLSGLSGFALANLCSYAALAHIPAGFFALLLPLAPILTVLGAAALGQERAGPRSIGGTALGLAGVALAMAPGAALPDPARLGWALLAVLTPVCFAASNLIAVRYAPPGGQPLAFAAGTLLLAAAQLGVLLLLTGGWRWPLSGPWEADAIMLGQGVLNGTAYLCFFRLIAAAGPVVTSQTGYIATLAGIAWGVALFGERLGWLTWPAAALVFAGLFLVTTRKR